MITIEQLEAEFVRLKRLEAEQKQLEIEVTALEVEVESIQIAIDGAMGRQEAADLIAELARKTGELKSKLKLFSDSLSH